MPGMSAQPESVKGAIAYDFGDRLELSDLDSGNRRIIVRTPRQSPGQLIWSRDGSAVAIVRYDKRRRSTDVHVANIAARSLRRVAHLPGSVTGTPSWSPRGDRIAFGWSSSNECDPKTALYVADIRSNRLRALAGRRQIDRQHVTLYQPFDWAPDGQRVLYGERTYYKECVLRDVLSSSLLHVGIDGKHPTVVRKSRDGSGEQAQWSPDGRLIAHANFGDSNGLIVTRPNGRVVRRFSSNGFAQFLKWSQRGDELYSNFGDDERIVAHRVSDGRRRTLFVYTPATGCDGLKFCSVEIVARSPTSGFVLVQGHDDNLDDELFVVATDGTSRFIGDPAAGNSGDPSTAFFLE
jgi:Tol biopolymer transport system component